MPGDREDEICQKALQLLAELCSVGAVENDNCRDFIYYLRDRARPRLTDSGTAAPRGGRREDPPQGSGGGPGLRTEASRPRGAAGRDGGTPAARARGTFPRSAGGRRGARRSLASQAGGARRSGETRPPRDSRARLLPAEGRAPGNFLARLGDPRPRGGLGGRLGPQHPCPVRRLGARHPRPVQPPPELPAASPGSGLSPCSPGPPRAAGS